MTSCLKENFPRRPEICTSVDCRAIIRTATTKSSYIMNYNEALGGRYFASINAICLYTYMELSLILLAPV